MKRAHERKVNFNDKSKPKFITSERLKNWYIRSAN